VEDPATAQVVADYENRLGQEMEVEVGNTTVPLDAISQNVRSQETNLGDFFADAMRSDVHADLCIVNSGSIRSNRIYPPGPLKRRDVVDLHPFGGVTCKVEVTGQTVFNALNWGFARLGEGLGRFPQVSGMSFDVDLAATATARVQNVRVQGQPLEMDRLYTVATTDYMTKGGDGYEMFLGSKILIDSAHGNLIANALESSIRQFGTISPQTEGRMRFVGPVPPPPPIDQVPRPIILDTDMGIDSVLGMLYLLKSPEVSVKAITIADGMSHVESGAESALDVLDLTGMRDIPVAMGPARPKHIRAFPDFWRVPADSVDKIQKRSSNNRPSPTLAPDLIIELLEKSPIPMTIITMGPLTNIAQALSKKPGITSKIKEFIIMGGALKVAGNVNNPYVGINNTVAEWNFYLNPQAAQIVMKSGVPTRLITLDSSHALPITPAFVERLRQGPRNSTSDFIIKLLELVQDGIEGGWYYFWDTLAAVMAVHPEVAGSQEVQVDVVTHNGPYLGRLKISPLGPSVRMAEELNRETFEAQFLKTIGR
jgi:pyrimidine-specific ribonucleoside hydrolase